MDSEARVGRCTRASAGMDGEAGTQADRQRSHVIIVSCVVGVGLRSASGLNMSDQFGTARGSVFRRATSTFARRHGRVEGEIGGVGAVPLVHCTGGGLGATDEGTWETT